MLSSLLVLPFQNYEKQIVVALAINANIPCHVGLKITSTF